MIQSIALFLMCATFSLPALAATTPVEVYETNDDGTVTCLIEGFQMYEFVYGNGKVVYSTSATLLTEMKGEELEWRPADALVVCEDRKFIRLEAFENE